MNLREGGSGKAVSGIPIGELNRHTSDVLRQVEAGERVIVTNHGRPVAALLPIPDGIDVLLAHLAMEGLRGTNDARHRNGVLMVELTARAAEQLAALQASRQVMLRAALRQAAIHSGGEGPFVVRTPQDLAACVALADRNTLLVYAAMARWQALEALLGPDLYSAWRMRNWGRLSHGRPAVRD
jgi:prevent-host-death family protein